ncbi:MAG: MBL fold metallo-hydrolase [Parachlamydia sp.]|nr:MBL fold metallo-hydrolase [Parachlamydia sp.]
MKLIFLGTGSAFTIGNGNYHSNMLLESDSRRLLIDCGSDIRFSLFEQGFSGEDVDDVFVSHLHADHVGGLEWLAFMRKFNAANIPKPKLYVSHDIVNDLWNHVLSGGLKSIKELNATLPTYFDVEVIENQLFVWQGEMFKLISAVHTYSDYKLVPCYGLFFPLNGKKVFITSDCQFVPELLKQFYEEADIIFHDCETDGFRSGIHAHYDELCLLNPEIKAKMWLYHYLPGQLPDAQKDGFLGFVKKGQIFE